MKTDQKDEEMTYEDFILLQQALNEWDYELDNVIREEKEAKKIHVNLEIIIR